MRRCNIATRRDGQNERRHGRLGREERTERLGHRKRNPPRLLTFPGDLPPEFLQGDSEKSIHLLDVRTRIACGYIPTKFGQLLLDMFHGSALRGA